MRFAFAPAVLLCLATSCSGPYSGHAVAAKETQRPLAVRVEQVTLQNIPEIITATGELYAEDLTTVSAKTPGRLANLLVDLGSRVQKGQVLAEIEQIEYEFRVKQADALVEQSRARLGLSQGSNDEVNPADTATVRQAAATLEEARLNFDRTKQLVSEGVLSRMEFDRMQAALRLAEARHQAAVEEIYRARAELSQRRAELAMAKQQLIEAVIRAPFAGAVTKRQASVGEYLAVNAPVLTLARFHPLRIRLEIPERLATRVHPGQQIDVRLAGSSSHSGRVVRLSPAIETQNRSLQIEGEIPNEDGSLRPGSFVEGALTVNAQAQGIAVPAGAVVSFAGVDRVFVAKDGVLSERVVKPGRKLPGERIEIVTGLNPGETIVAEASDRLTNGQKIQAHTL